LVSLAATHTQLLKIILPSLTNLNLRPVGPDTGSTHEAQLPHVLGHAAETPTREQRLLVSLLATQLQDLVSLVPSALKVRILKGVSTQVAVDDEVGLAVGLAVGVVAATGDAVGVVAATGDAVGLAVGLAVGDVVGPIGDADGDGEGLIEFVGELVGASLGTTLGAKLGVLLGFTLGESLGT
jgi:hypothetical protein